MDLELVTTEDMIQELFRRHDAAVVLLNTRRTSDGGAASIRFDGNPFETLGMCQFAIQKLTVALHQSIRFSEEGEVE